MSRPSFTEIQAQEDSVNRLQKNIKTAINPVLALPFSAGVHKKDVAITTSDTLTKQNADTNIYVSTTTNTLPNRQVILKAGSSVTADLFFF